ncbi:hypothetical protein SBV1_1080008 [Verrucomicrobia bacterium]|nr:hypothetical protein SBV1_1080008 [Verrucomicrobiota bacterium]
MVFESGSPELRKLSRAGSESFREQELSGRALPPSPSYGGTGHTLREVRPRRRRWLSTELAP